MKKRVIAYLHTHWDREWYREFEIFRMRLLRVFDEVIEALEQDLIPSFFFDGQVVALLDYLKIRPQNEQRIRDLIKQKKLFIGPFYCLIDEFLTSETLFKKNLEYGLEIAKNFGCKDFTGYLPDTFGHSDGVIKILKEFGLNEAIVWRGCPSSTPAEFIWQDVENNSINTINLVRGYFMDIFTTKLSIEEKANFLQSNLDKIAERSGNTLLLPIGADHLGTPTDIKSQIETINNLLEGYNIELGSIFDYIDAVKNNYSHTYKGELRDNSATFTLEGSYSSRADIKQMNIIATHQLERASKLVKYFNLEDKYNSLLKYAYKLLLKNQAHDSICGCSTDDTHTENILRYKKIYQIASQLEAEIKFSKNLYGQILNLNDKEFSGVIEYKKYEITRDDVVFSQSEGFREDLLVDTKRIPITEDYLPIYTTLEYVKNVPIGCTSLASNENYRKINTKENSLNDIVVVDNVVKIKDIEIYPRDFKDNGDSYNRGVIINDTGNIPQIKSCKNIFNSPLRGVIQVEYDDNSLLEITLDTECDFIKLNYIVDNKIPNHHLQLCFNLKEPIYKTLSEDMNRIIERNFDPNYDIRDNLPTSKGVEARTNTAPCQRLVWANGYGTVLKGITQYEIVGEELRLSILRATGIISTPKNSTRTTPAGPPLSTPDGQLLKRIEQEIYIFKSDCSNLKSKIDDIYNFIYV